MSELQVATVGIRSGSKCTLIFDGETTASQKEYGGLTISSVSTLTAGSRVLVAKVSGTYVIIGKIQS